MIEKPAEYFSLAELRKITLRLVFDNRTKLRQRPASSLHQYRDVPKDAIFGSLLVTTALSGHPSFLILKARLNPSGLTVWLKGHQIDPDVDDELRIVIYETFYC
jgi:hypothetical protein